MKEDNINWVNGFLEGESELGIPSKSLATESQRELRKLPFPLNLHANSLFQFYIVPLVELIRLNGREQINTCRGTIWFSSFRETQSLFPFDFKEWCFRKERSALSIVRVGILFALLARSLVIHAQLCFLNFRERNHVLCSGGDWNGLILLRKPVQLAACDSSFYADSTQDMLRVLFFNPKRKLKPNECLAPIRLGVLSRALKLMFKSLFLNPAKPNGLNIGGIDCAMDSAYFESIMHFDVWVYNEQLKEISASSTGMNDIFSFEQVSWAAELEKIVFENKNIRHMQIGILPYYPYPTLGLGSEFLIRSKTVLDKFRTEFPGRQFSKLKLSEKIFDPVRFDSDVDVQYIFASQPYRKSAEKALFESIVADFPQVEWKIKYHPRDRKTYLKHNEIDRLRPDLNQIVVTRTSSLILEMFVKGIPYFCYIDEEDAALDQGEVAKVGDVVVFGSISDLTNALSTPNIYVERFKAWRQHLLEDYV